MSKKIFTLLCCIAAVSLSQAQTWNGNTSTNWNTASNWTPATVPIASGNVVIPNTANKPKLASNIIINNFTMNLSSGLDFNGFAFTCNGDFDINGATLTNSNGATDISITLNGGSILYFRQNVVNDNIIINHNSATGFYEGYEYPDTFNGNFTINSTGASILSTCFDNPSAFNGNVTINRSIAGTSEIFRAGAVAVKGNFSYTNNAGGNTIIHQLGGNKVPITGTINISATGTGNPVFFMNLVQNNTSGGTISVQNSGLITITNDTLKVSAFNANGYKDANTHDFLFNQIAGTINISDNAANTGYQYFRGNTINGNTTFTINSASGFYEGYQYRDIFNGNVTVNNTGTGILSICYDTPSAFNGNFTVNRTGAGVSEIFKNGAVAVTGNFSYTNNAGGNTVIRQSGAAKVIVAGTINITATGAGNPVFFMNLVQNNTTGGTISVQNSGLVTLSNDTLAVTALNINGYRSVGVHDFLQNQITGTVNISDNAANTGYQYFRGNTINGNTILTVNSTGGFYESFQYSSTYNGNLTVNRNNGNVFLAYDNTSNYNQNLTINSASGISFTNFVKFGGNTYGIIEQTGTQPLIFPRLEMQKTGGATLTLNDSVTVSTSLTFSGGNIISSAANPVIFLNDATQTGASLSSHVVGAVTKIGDDDFIFPTGGPASYNSVAMTAPTGATSIFKAEYKFQNPTSDGLSTSSKAATLSNISKAGYWKVQRLSGTSTPALTFGFGANPYQQFPALANLKVALWNGTQWTDKGNGGTTGTAASGTIKHTGSLTTYGNFALANNLIETYFYVYGNPGAGPDGTPVKFKAIGGNPAYQTKQLPAGVYSADSIYLIPNASTASFKLKDVYGVEKNDTTVTAPTAPAAYIAANGNGTINFTGWRHFVYVKNAGNQIIGAIRDNNLTLGNTVMTAYFSTANVANAPNGNIYLKRSFKITSQFAPVGAKRVRFYITKTEFNNLAAADPTAFPNGINSLTITKYTGAEEDSLFNPIAGGNSTIIPNSDITIADLGTLYSLDIDVTDFSGFYIGGNQTNISVCAASSVSLPTTATGATYKWQVNTGNGFVNITNGTIYSGVTSKTLSIANVPGTYYGYQYRCVVNGNTNSQVYTLKFTATWHGTVSNVWENAANWNCGVLPNANTDVLINAGKPNYPQVGANTSVRSLKAVKGTSVTVKTGFNLTIVK